MMRAQNVLRLVCFPIPQLYSRTEPHPQQVVLIESQRIRSILEMGLALLTPVSQPYNLQGGYRSWEMSENEV